MRERENYVINITNNDKKYCVNSCLFYMDNEKKLTFIKQLILKETHWYTMRSESKSLTPQFEEDITKAEWIDKKDVSHLMEKSYPSLCNLWNKIQFIINQ